MHWEAFQGGRPYWRDSSSYWSLPSLWWQTHQAQISSNLNFSLQALTLQMPLSNILMSCAPSCWD